MTSATLKHVVVGALFCSLAALTPAWSTAGGPLASNMHWTDAWTASPDSAGPPLGTVTVRQVIRTSIGGSSVRIRLSNLFGTAPVTIGPVHVAEHASGSEIKPGTDHTVTFGGKARATIAKGGDVLSDPIALSVAPLEDLAVSMYFPTRTGTSTFHGVGNDTAFITLTGDATAAIRFPPGEVTSSRIFLTDVEVATGNEAQTIVAIGDSITDGVGSTQDKNSRWPDALAARLHADPAHASIAVVDAGIAGNRILHDGATPFVGPSALVRLDRDALNKPSVHWLLVMEGINDIAAADMLATPRDDVSTQQIIDGMKTLIGRAHKRGVKIFGVTLTPYGGVEWPFHSAAGEAKRQVVNAWIRHAGAFDAVIDFDQVVRDPAHTDCLLATFDSGDHLHPNDAGYKAMAAAVDLRLFALRR
ncbi:SGNH/GDSL hydrolase family protein [Rhodanobacter sp. MP7CTX1]|uniref:SGNH/GDSL hydrolase family protein n=1 Tax=Rhodanobacter sp. MP7CTX1 TaxID=2723084 RepID=UPI001617B163|nr:SGNH/GDSL hydrolase family protein [Rhodanobacter sp. MP7CTX1]MBB6187105.1 lysophospholipase L1-like esterase [Rhodanobacter sp. MP7CTX1]